MSYNKTLFFGGEWRTTTRLKMRTRKAILMSKVRNSSAPKLILGTRWGMHMWSLAIPCQACLSINFKVLMWTMSQQLELIAFSASFLSSGETLLNWLRGEPNKKQVLGKWTVFITATVHILVLDDIKDFIWQYFKRKHFVTQKKQYPSEPWRYL